MLCTCYSLAPSPCPGTTFVAAPTRQPKPPEPPWYRAALPVPQQHWFHWVFHQEDRDLAQREAAAEDAAASTSVGISSRAGTQPLGWRQPGEVLLTTLAHVPSCPLE